ncbi:MAG: TlpA family protein disulfide reductase [Bacteroidetes bacterium]|nr:TlpA family protein disulfide reductase [Bacteroidota bacterium]
MKNIFLSILLLLSINLFGQQNGTLLSNGTIVPKFNFEIEKGKTINISDYKGKVVLINFFATWCGPCRMELPLLQKEIWEKYQDNEHFALLIFGREEGWQKVIDFKTTNRFTFPMLPDEDKSIYKLFATQYIPRNVLLDEDGKIVYQSIGFNADEFNKMKKIIDKLILKK